MTTLARPPVLQRVGGGVIAAFAAVYVIWGSTYLFIRIAVETMPPLLMAGVRFLIAGAVLLAITAPHARRGAGTRSAGGSGAPRRSPAASSCSVATAG